MSNEKDLKTMYLISSYVGDKESFRLMPISLSCPYSEGIYEPHHKSLILIAKDQKETYHFIPKLDDNGDISKVKMPRKNSNKDYKEERRLTNTPYEHIIIDKNEIRNVIQLICHNFDVFDYNKYLNSDLNENK